MNCSTAARNRDLLRNGFRRCWIAPVGRAFAAIFLFAVVLTQSLHAVESVRLNPYPQKLTTFYRLTHSALPSALRSNAVPLPVGNLTATAGTYRVYLYLKVNGANISIQEMRFDKE